MLLLLLLLLTRFFSLWYFPVMCECVCVRCYCLSEGLWFFVFWIGHWIITCFIIYIVYAFSTLLLRKQNDKKKKKSLQLKSGFGLQDGWPTQRDTCLITDPSSVHNPGLCGWSRRSPTLARIPLHREKEKKSLWKEPLIASTDRGEIKNRRQEEEIHRVALMRSPFIDNG